VDILMRKAHVRSWLHFIVSPMPTGAMPRRGAVSVDARADLAQGNAVHDVRSLPAGDLNQYPEALFFLSLLYLFIPSAIVLFYFAPWPIAVFVASVLAIFWARGGGKVQKWNLHGLSNTWPYLILAAGVVWLAGVLPPFAENLDWYKHYAIFNALSDQSWPPKFLTGDAISTLRYSLSYYVAPSLAVKLLGPWVLSVAIFAWTTLGCYLALILAFGTGARAKLTCFGVGLIFLLFSGADILGTYFTGAFPNPPMPSMHFEWWAYFGELPSSITSIFWTPQHAISGWIAALLFIRYPRQAVRSSGVIACAAAIWSPFIAIGLMPVVIWAVLTTGFRALLSKSNILLAPVLLISAALFLTQGATGIPSSMVWNTPDVMWHVHKFSLSTWVLFICLEFFFLALALSIITPEKRVLIGIHGFFLLILCFFSAGVYNDLLMRASIPALGVLAVLLAEALVFKSNTFRKIPVFVLFIAGLATPFGEIQRGFNLPRITNIHELSILDVIYQNRSFGPQYLVRTNDHIKVLAPVFNEKGLILTKYGNADFDLGFKRVQSATYTDSGLVSQAIILPAGYYKLEATLDWDVSAEVLEKNGAHISLHGKSMLIPIKTSHASNKSVSDYFYANGRPFNISFGLGGWSSGKGYIELKKLTLSPVEKFNE